MGDRFEWNTHICHLWDLLLHNRLTEEWKPSQYIEGDLPRLLANATVTLFRLNMEINLEKPRSLTFLGFKNLVSFIQASRQCTKKL